MKQGLVFPPTGGGFSNRELKKMRQIEGKASWGIGALYVGFVGWSIYGAIWPVETYAFRMIHMAFIYGLAFLIYPYKPDAGRWTLAPDVILSLLGVAVIAYGFVDMDNFIRRSTLPESMDMFFGIAAIIGAGSFSSMGTACASGGPGVVLLFIMCAVACGFTAMCYAEFAARVPVSGSA